MEKFENFITVRLLMQGKEVGSIIGKKGDNIKQIREQSGARITISDGSTPERIVTINGLVENVNKAFSMICKKFEDDLMQTCNANSIPPITLRLIVPASQCGSIIGKGGSKIKEIRELTGASIQVASEMLPGSTERAVTVSGKLDSIIECFKQVSAIMLESPPKGDTLSYKPRQVQNTPQNTPIIFAHGQAYSVQGQFAVPLPPHEVAKLIQMGAFSQVQPQGPMPPYYYPEDEKAKVDVKSTYGAYPQLSLAPNQFISPLPPSAAYTQTPQPVAPHPPHPQQTQPPINVVNQTQASGPPRPSIHNVQTHEMNIPNDLIGCIIGRGGQKISEIRLVSGANIKIADLEEGNPDRHVSMTGTPDQIQLAQFLINASTNLLANSLNTTVGTIPSSISSNDTSTTTSPSATTNFSQYFNKTNPFSLSTHTIQQLQGKISSNDQSAITLNPAIYTGNSQSYTYNNSEIQKTQAYKKSGSTTSEAMSNESNDSHDNESSANLNDSTSSISTSENNENNQSLTQKQQSEIALKLQQEMNKKNQDAQMYKNNQILHSQQQQHQSMFFLNQPNLLQPNIFNLPLIHQQLATVPMNQSYKINSFQNDETTRQLKRNLIHFKPY